MINPLRLVKPALELKTTAGWGLKDRESRKQTTAVAAAAAVLLLLLQLERPDLWRESAVTTEKYLVFLLFRLQSHVKYSPPFHQSHKTVIIIRLIPETTCEQ